MGVVHHPLSPIAEQISLVVYPLDRIHRDRVRIKVTQLFPIMGGDHRKLKATGKYINERAQGMANSAPVIREGN